jgi:hypothetical protein
VTSFFEKSRPGENFQQKRLRRIERKQRHVQFDSLERNMALDSYLTLVPRGLHYTVQEMILQQLLEVCIETEHGETSTHTAAAANLPSPIGTTTEASLTRTTSYQAEITILGDDYGTHRLPPRLQQQQQQQQSQLNDDVKNRRINDNDESDHGEEERDYVQHLAKLLRVKLSVESKKGQSHKRRRQEDIIPFTCILPVGTSVTDKSSSSTTGGATTDGEASSSSSLPLDHRHQHQHQQHQREVSLGYINHNVGENQTATRAIWSLPGHMPGLV